MKPIKRIFTPLTSTNNSTFSALVILYSIVAIGLWQFFATGGLIPTPLKIGESVIKILSSTDFFDNLFISLTLTLKGMGYSIIIALLVSYLS